MHHNPGGPCYLDGDVGVVFCPWLWKGWLEVIDVDYCDHQAAQAVLRWGGAEVSGLNCQGHTGGRGAVQGLTDTNNSAPFVNLHPSIEGRIIGLRILPQFIHIF